MSLEQPANLRESGLARKCEARRDEEGSTGDIAERAEDALRHSEELLRLITNLVPHGIFAKDAAGRHIFANRALAEMAGISTEEIVGKSDFDLVADKAQAEAYRADDLAVIKSGKEMVISEEPRTDLSGRTRLLQTIKIPFTVAKTGERAVLGVCTDITERKRAEASLQESEERFRSMFSATATGIAISTPDGRFLQANAAYCRMRGYTEDELRARTFASVTHPQDLQLNLALRDEVLAGRRDSFVMEKRYLKKGGDIVWTRHSVSAVRATGGRITRLIVVAENITEQKRAQEAVLRQQTELQVLFDLMPAMLFFKDTKNVFLRVNHRVAEAIGRPIAEIEGKSAAELFPLESDKYYADDLEVIHSRTAKLEIIEQLQSRDGKVLWVRTDKVPVCDNDGNVTGIVVMVQDITERKLAEFRLHRLNRLHTVLSKCSDAIVRMRTRQELYDAVCRIIAEDGKLRMVFISEVVDHLARLARPVAADGAWQITVPEPTSSAPVGEDPLSMITVSTAIQTGVPDICNDIGGTPPPKPWQEAARRNGLLAYASFPLQLHGATVAVLVLYAGETDYFLDDEIRLMVTVADNLSFALEALEEEQQRKQAEENLQAQMVRLNLLSQITRAIGGRLDLQSILQVVIRSVEDDLPVDFACVCFHDQSADALQVMHVGVKSEATLRLRRNTHGLGQSRSRYNARSDRYGMTVDERGAMRRLLSENTSHVGFGLALVVLAGIILLSYQNVRRVADAAESRRQDYANLDLLQDFLPMAIDIETGARGYVITGDPRFLEPYRAGLTAIGPQLQALYAALADYSDQQPALAQLAEAVAQLRDDSGQVVSLEAGNQRASANSEVASGRGKHAMDQIRRLILELSAENREQLLQRDRQFQTSLRWSMRLIVTASLIGLAAIVAAAAATSRNLAVRNRLNAELCKAQEGLEQQVLQRTVQLRQAADDLRQNEQRYRSLVEATAAVVWNTSASGIVEADLPGWAAFTGQTQEQIRGIGWVDAVHPDDRARTAEVWSAAVASKQNYSTEYRLRTAGGEYRHMMVRGVPVPEEDGSIREWVGTCTDITEQRRAEQALATKTAFLVAQTEACLDGILVVDAQQNKIFQNRQFADFWQIPQHIFEQSSDEGTLRFVVDCAKNPEEFLARVNHLYAHPNETAREEIELKSGRILDRYSAPVKDSNGNYHGRIWTFRDVTEGKRLEAELTRARAKLIDAIESLDAGLVIYDPDDRLVVCNSKYANICAADAHAMVPGMSYEDILRNVVKSGVPDLTGDSADDWIARRVAAHRIPGVPLVMRLGGRWVHVTDRRTSEGGVVSLVTDITALKHAQDAAEAAQRLCEEQLEEMEQLYRRAPVGLELLDRDYRVLRVNERLAAINGKSVQEHLGRDLRVIVPQLAAQIEAVVEGVFTTGEPALDSERHGFTPADPENERVWLVSYYPVKSPDGITRCVGGVVQEITDRKPKLSCARPRKRRKPQAAPRASSWQT
jgi:PAS domain S-box-containing protein